jgi:hypothetical protein
LQTRSHPVIGEPSVAGSGSADTHATARPTTPPPVLMTAPADAVATAPADADPHETARAQRVALVERVSHSGKHREKWAGQGEALLDDIASHAERIDDRGCYLSGCMASYTFASNSAYQDMLQLETTTPQWAKWTGGKRWSAVEDLDGGRVIVTLVLYRPD